MDVLREMFPAYPVHLLQQILQDTDDSVQDAVVILLESDLPAEENQIPSPPALGEHVLLDDEDSLPEEFFEVHDGDGVRVLSSGKDKAGEALSKIEDETLNGRSDKRKDGKAQPPELDDVLAQVVGVFPDVCPDYVKKSYTENIETVERSGRSIVDVILHSLLDLGSRYPRAEADNPRKRKRTIDGLEKSKFESKDRECTMTYTCIARKMLQQAFPLCPMTYIERVLLQNKFLAHSYAIIQSVYDDVKPPFERLKTSRKAVSLETERNSKLYPELIEELDYAKEQAKIQKKNAQLETDARLAATLDIEEHEENGMMIECQCCYGESPFSGMTQCKDGHLFCIDCAKKNAETEVGRGRYQLLCMAGCKSEFPRQEMLRFLDEKLILALEKNEQEDVLRRADLKDLTKCPFCDYAAICLPIEEDKEFRCRNPDCMEVSCRHCQQITHIPQTCEEVSKDGKLSIRHKLEEAMTDALVRTCKKCNNKFIKESGCNKMSCSRCHTLQCYVCSETINGYDHFNDTSRGGSKTNKCPLFDNTDERHDDDVQKAAKEVMERLKEENPHITDEDLEIKLSEAVKKKAANSGRQEGLLFNPPPAPAARPPPAPRRVRPPRHAPVPQPPRHAPPAPQPLRHALAPPAPPAPQANIPVMFPIANAPAIIFPPPPPVVFTPDFAMRNQLQARLHRRASRTAAAAAAMAAQIARQGGAANAVAAPPAPMYVAQTRVLNAQGNQLGNGQQQQQQYQQHQQHQQHQHQQHQQRQQHQQHQQHQQQPHLMGQFGAPPMPFGGVPMFNNNQIQGGGPGFNNMQYRNLPQRYPVQFNNNGVGNFAPFVFHPGAEPAAAGAGNAPAIIPGLGQNARPNQPGDPPSLDLQRRRTG